MPTQSQQAKPRKLPSTRQTVGNPLSLSAPRPVLTVAGQQLPLSRQHAANIPTSTNSMPTQSKRTMSGGTNDPELLAGILRATVQAMSELKLLAVVKTQSGKLAIILPTDIFNDDLTMKGTKR
jgi:hypothetical protein